MYNPAHFTVTDETQLYALIERSPLGTLVTHSDGLDANHLPFELDRAARRLRAHCARANPVWRQARDAEALVIFHGEQHYISPNWYPGMADTHRRVPTWNYEVVHVHGTMRIRDDVDYLRSVVSQLTQTHETQEPRPWSLHDAPGDYIDANLRAIVGIEIDIVRIVGKFKLGQNLDPRDREGAASALAALDSPLASRMRGG